MCIRDSSSVVETTIAPLPRPRPHLRQAHVVTSDAESSTAVATSSGSSSPWHSVNTPPIIEPVPVDPFSNVDPFAGSVSPDDPFAEPSLDGMLSDLCHDFDTDTLSVTAFRTRAVTIDSVSSDVSDGAAAAAVSSSVRHHKAAGSVSNESRSNSHCSASNLSPVLSQTVQTTSTEAVGTGCLVDLNTFDDTDDSKWQPFADKSTASLGSQATSGLALYSDLADVWYGSGSVDWKPASTVSVQSSDIFDSSVSSAAVPQLDSSSSQPVVGMLDTCLSDVAVCQAGACTDAQTSHSSLQSHSVTSSSCAADQRSTIDFNNVADHSQRAVSEPPTLSQVVLSVEHRISSLDAVFGHDDGCLTSLPANGTSLVTEAEVAVASTNTSEIYTGQLSVNNKQHDSISADLPANDVQVIH